MHQLCRSLTPKTPPKKNLKAVQWQEPELRGGVIAQDVPPSVPTRQSRQEAGPTPQDVRHSRLVGLQVAESAIALHHLVLEQEPPAHDEVR